MGIKLSIALVLLTMGSCTPTQLRISYAKEVARCTTNERAIVDRQDTTLEQDHAALDAERERCDAALAAIEHGGE